jgi:hypothetical protein
MRNHVRLFASLTLFECLNLAGTAGRYPSVRIAGLATAPELLRSLASGGFR